MGAAWFRARAVLRRSARTSVLLAAFIGLAGGVVLSAVAGARRSNEAFPRFERWHQTTDASLSIYDATDLLADQLGAVRALPEVQEAYRGRNLLFGVHPSSDPAAWRVQLGSVSLDDGGTRTFGRPIVVAGLLPREDRADDVAVNEEFAARHHVRVGSTFPVTAYTRAQFAAATQESAPAPAGASAQLHVVAIVRHPMDLLPPVRQDNILGDNFSRLYLTPAFWRRDGPDIGSFGVGIDIKLRRGKRDLPVLQGDVQRMVGPRVLVSGQPYFSSGAPLTSVRHATRLDSLAMLAFGILAGAAAVVLVGQALARQLRSESADDETLRGFGFTSRELVVAAALRALPIAAAGAVVGCALGFALSPLAPMGVSRRAEIDPGFRFDGRVLLPGALIILVLVVAAGVAPVRRSARVRASAQARVSGVVLDLPLAATTRIGVGRALDRGDESWAIWLTIGSAAAAVALIVGAATFAASIVHLGRSPSDYGATWDVSVGNYSSFDRAAEGARLLSTVPGVAAYAAAVGPFVLLDGHEVPVVAVGQVEGLVSFTELEGRDPRAPDEIALGTSTLHQLGKRIGDAVEAKAPAGDQATTLRIVGRAVVNANYLTPPLDAGEGGIVDFRSLSVLAPTDPPQQYLIRMQTGANRIKVIDDLRSRFGATLMLPVPPPDVVNLEAVSALPGLLAGLVAVLALATLGHTLAVSVRARRTELAILKTIGFVRRQVSATAAWQATTVAVVGLVIGLPLGIAGGRWAWNAVADQLGVVPAPTVPVAWLAVTAAAVILAFNLVAAGPAWAAGRVHPASALRSE